MASITQGSRPDKGTILEDRAVEWLKKRFPSAKLYAHAAQITPETAKKRLANDDLDRRGLRLSELGRAIADDWQDFIEEVWRPTFETPDEKLENQIHALKQQLAELETVHSSKSVLHRATLLTDGTNQAVQIPNDLQLPGSTVSIRRVGNSLLIEPMEQMGLVEWLASLEPLDEDFPEMDDRIPEPFEL